MQNFRNLRVWRTARDLALTVYAHTTQFPKEETFGLKSQMRRASVSICANIAEGCARRGDREFGHFLSIAQGSASELECEALISQDIGFLSDTDTNAIVQRAILVMRMLNALQRTVRSDSR